MRFTRRRDVLVGALVGAELFFARTEHGVVMAARASGRARKMLYALHSRMRISSELSLIEAAVLFARWPSCQYGTSVSK